MNWTHITILLAACLKLSMSVDRGLGGLLPMKLKWLKVIPIKRRGKLIQLVIMLHISDKVNKKSPGLPCSFLHNMDGLHSNFATNEVVIT